MVDEHKIPSYSITTYDFDRKGVTTEWFILPARTKSTTFKMVKCYIDSKWKLQFGQKPFSLKLLEKINLIK